MTEKHEALENLLRRKEELEDEIENFSIDPSDCEDKYCEMLDDVYPELFNMSPSYILRESDPIAYRAGLLDFADNLDVTEDDRYKELEDELAELETEIEDLEAEIEELEDV